MSGFSAEFMFYFINEIQILRTIVPTNALSISPFNYAKE